MFKVAKIIFAIYFALLFARAAFAKEECGNNESRRAKTTATATPTPSSQASGPKSDGQRHGVKR